MTQNNLGNALQTLGARESGTARLEEAVAAYRAALEERTRARVPLDWATTQNNLGDALQALGARESGTARLEEAVAAYGEAISLNPKYFSAYFSRGRAYLYGGSLAKAQADFKQANELDPKHVYAALWLDLAERRNNLPSHLAQAAKQLDIKQWPAPVVRLFLGELSPAETLDAADHKDSKTKQGQVCEANFYSAERALSQSTKEEATRLFRLAASDCPHDFIEWDAANAELKALGVAP
jgi:lipoprotein NlpI